MAGATLNVGDLVTVDRTELQNLLDVLKKKRYRILGPTVRDRAIVLDSISHVEDLPIGVTDEQDGGAYRLKDRGDDSVFGYVVGQHSWKNHLYPYILRLWKAERNKTGFHLTPDAEKIPKPALFGVRSCDLHAIRILDRILMEGDYKDEHYARARKNACIIAVNCTEAHGTCFCASMETGPKAVSGFDLALTEILDGSGHRFVVDVGSELGVKLLESIPSKRASKADEKADGLTSAAAGTMDRAMDTHGIQDLLYNNFNHPRWDDVVKRCLLCGNCTMVCPTCFCSTIADVTDVSGKQAERWRRLDSCFTLDFSYIHGGSVRSTPCSRYRQWMVHKLAAWIDQFGTSGCVGCGRCITWCPVGIDITEEVREIRETAGWAPPVRRRHGSRS